MFKKIIFFFWLFFLNLIAVDFKDSTLQLNDSAEYTFNNSLSNNDSILIRLENSEKLLYSIENKLNSYDPNWWFPLIAYLIAGLISLVVALLTIRANVISRSRIQWIQNLRDTMADYLSFSLSINEYYNNPGNDKKLHISNIVRMRSKESKLKLLLNNPNEDSHKSLITAIDNYTSTIQNLENSADNNVTILKEKCIVLTQELLKTEWEKAKKESVFWHIFLK